MDALARDVARLGRAQERGQERHVGRVAEIAERDVAGELGLALGGRVQALVDLLAVDSPGRSGIPCRPISRVCPFAQAWTPAFAATAALTPDGSAVPVTQSTRPQRRSIIPGRSAWVVRRTAVKLIENDSSQAASGESHGMGREPPALLIKMSTRP